MDRALQEFRAFLTASLLTPVDERPAEQGRALVRRRGVVGATVALGAVALGLALTVTPGDPAFYAATLGVAALWVIGALASGPLRLGRGRARAGGETRGVLQGLILGLILLVVVLAGAVVVASVPVLRGPV
ncbi:MAG: CPBP family intramembrane glutamate endopeptidase, partial [Actinomycetes bacterium]